MDIVVMTKVTTPIIGWVSSILGWIINAVYALLAVIGIPNIGLAIILFTVIVYMAMMPLQIKQQKFTKLNGIMQPEINKIQEKYKGKKDQDSVMKQNEEINAVYQKYGVSPTGSCVQLLVQMPVLLALYQVIYHIPGYISGVREIFSGLADNIMSVSGFGDIISKFLTDNRIVMYGVNANSEFTKEVVIDFLYKLSPSQMKLFSDLSQFSQHADAFSKVADQAERINQFFVLNISDTPMAIIRSGWTQGGAAGYLMVFAAVMVPFLAWLTQRINYKLIPQPENNRKPNEQPSTMEATMKSMNTFMPIMSAFFCLSLPVGMGIYWIIGAVIRSFQQIFLNKTMSTMDIDAYIKENQEKMKKKMEKRGIDPEQINRQAKLSTRNIQSNSQTSSQPERTQTKSARNINYENKNYKPGSLAAKANMVKQFDERNKKK